MVVSPSEVVGQPRFALRVRSRGAAAVERADDREVEPSTPVVAADHGSAAHVASVDLYEDAEVEVAIVHPQHAHAAAGADDREDTGAGGARGMQPRVRYEGRKSRSQISLRPVGARLNRAVEASLADVDRSPWAGT